MGHGQVFRETHCKIVETVGTNTFGCWQVVVRTHVDIDDVFVEPVGIRLCSP